MAEEAVNLEDALALNQQQTIVIQQLTNTVNSLQQQLDWFKRQLFGSKSERLLDLASGTPMLPGLELVVNSESEVPATKVVSSERRAHRNQTGWQELPEDLPREEVIIKLPEEQKFNANGEPLKLIGHDVFERLAYRGGYFVKVFKREKYADPNDTLQGIITAPHPGDMLGSKSGKSKFDISFIAQAIVEKCLDYMPFYRQQERLARLGIKVDRSTLCRLFAGASETLEPIYDRLVKLIMACEIIHADETSIKMLAPGNGKCKTAWLWCRMSGIGPPLTTFAYETSRGQNSANRLLGDYSGTIISDQYNVYETLGNTKDSTIINAGCWAHARRYFEKSLKATPGDADALRVMCLIRQLYTAERQAKELANGLSKEKVLFQQRQKLRRKTSRTAVKEIFKLCEELKFSELPSSLLYKAANYTLNARKQLSRFLDNPKINIDNNPAENAIRGVALGRKNYLFTGNETGGRNLAILLSLLTTCKLNNQNPQAWLEDVLSRIHTTPAKNINSLLPHLWEPPE